MHRLYPCTRILIVDGLRGRVYRNQGDALQPRLVLIRAYDDHVDDMAGHDRPHGVVNYFTARRQRHQGYFIKRVATQMNRDFCHGSFCHLVVAAPPPVMMPLRQLLTEPVRSTVTLEIPENLTAASVSEILKAVAAGFAAGRQEAAAAARALRTRRGHGAPLLRIRFADGN